MSAPKLVPLLTVRDAARLLAVNEQTVRRMLDDGQLASQNLQKREGPKMRNQPQTRAQAGFRFRRSNDRTRSSRVSCTRSEGSVPSLSPKRDVGSGSCPAYAALERHELAALGGGA